MRERSYTKAQQDLRDLVGEVSETEWWKIRRAAFVLSWEMLTTTTGRMLDAGESSRMLAQLEPIAADMVAVHDDVIKRRDARGLR